MKVIFIVLLFFGCKSKNPKSDIIEYSRYKDCPQTIRGYMDSAYGYKGKFLIAEKGEKWNKGCGQNEKEPGCQFVTALINNGIFYLEIQQGGLVIFVEKHRFLIKENKVLSHYLETKLTQSE